jgi:hypothetical protein
MPSSVTLNTRTLAVVGLILMAVITAYSIASARAESTQDSGGQPAADIRTTARRSQPGADPGRVDGPEGHRRDHLVLRLAG